MSSTIMAAILAALSGLSLAVIGVTFRWGQSKNVVPLHISTAIGTFGAIFFAFKADFSTIGQLPAFIYIIAIANGIGQIVTMVLTKVSLRKGPLSPVWCAMNLTFLLVTVYSAIVFSESISLMQYLALASGIISVIFASSIGAEKTQDQVKSSLKDKLIYGIMLIFILLGNAIIFVAIKDLGTRMIPGQNTTYLGSQTANIYFIFYVVLAISNGSVAAFQKTKPTSIKYLLGLGSLAGAGSICGMLLLSLCAQFPAAIVFTVNGAIIILGGALASVIFFGEKMTRGWYGTIGFGILAVIFANLDKFI
jgi:drug/metabolite transporter (DMT)-like permease